MSATKQHSFKQILEQTQKKDKADFLSTIDNHEQRDIISQLIDKLQEFDIWSCNSTNVSPSNLAERIIADSHRFNELLTRQLVISAKECGFNSPATFVISKIKEDDGDKFFEIASESALYSASESEVELYILGYIATEGHFTETISMPNLQGYRVTSKVNRISAEILATKFLNSWEDFVGKSDTYYAKVRRFIQSQRVGKEETQDMIDLLASALESTGSIFKSSGNTHGIQQDFISLLELGDNKDVDAILSCALSYISVFEKNIFSHNKLADSLVNYLHERGYTDQQIVKSIVMRNDSDDAERNIIISDILQLVGVHLISEVDKFAMEEAYIQDIQA